MIAAVTFDFWNTIARVPSGAITAARRRAVAEACAACGTEVEADLVARSLEEVGAHWERSWAAGTHLHPEEGAEMVVRALGVEGEGRRQVAEAFLGAAGEAPIETAPGIGDCLEALRGRGVRIGIVCDAGFAGGAVLRGVLDRFGLLGHFEGWAFSDEVGHYKPAPQMFEAVLAALAARPVESLHVGDLRRTDVAGAAAAGMRTARYRGLNDDPDSGAGVEAEFVLDSHAELPALLDRIAAG